MTYDKRVPLSPPSSAELRKHLLIVMGTLSGWKTGVFISHKEAKQAATTHAGYDPNNLAQYGDPEDGWRMNGGHASFKSFGRRIWNAFRRGYWLKKIPLTEKGLKRGQWGLTAAGLETARSYAGLRQIGNTTAQFLDQRLKETGGLDGKFWGLLKAAVAYKLPISARADTLDDHVQTCMMRLIHRDAFHKKLIAGQPITDTHIATYVVRSAFNDCRDAATDALTREVYGARTAKERIEGVATVNTADSNNVTWDLDKGCWSDIVDNSSINILENKMNFQEIWGQLEKIIKRRHLDSWKQHMKFVQLRSGDRTIREIADLMKIPIPQARTLKRNVQKCQDFLWKTGVMDGVLEKQPIKQAVIAH